MSRLEKILGIIFLVGVLILFCWCFGEIIANAHEGHGFTHMDGGSGPIIGSRYCPGTLTQLWTIDLDGDGAGDKCTLIFFNHEKIHVRDIPRSEDGCVCPTVEEE
jgi:hypothetical protein